MPDETQRGIFQRALVWLFGASWQTSLSGIATIAAYFIHDKPVVIHWIPEPAQSIIWNISEYVFIGGIGALAWRSKDKNLTGGSVQQSYGGWLVDIGKQDMVDQTIKATVASGEHVPEEVKAAVQ